MTRVVAFLLVAGGAWLAVAPHDRMLATVVVAFGTVAYAYWRLTVGSGGTRWLELRPEQLDELSGLEFEQWVMAVLAHNRLSPTATATTGDFGVDIIAEYRGLKFGVQAKKRKGKNVGNAAVQQVNAGCDYYGCDLAVVVTQSKFTSAAKAQAERLVRPCLLLGRDELPSMGALFKEMADRSVAEE